MIAYGIELGSTKACIAKSDQNGNIHIIPNVLDGDTTLTCSIFFDNSNEIVIGRNAKDMAEVDPFRLIQSIPREIGNSPCAYEFCGRSYSTIELVALILRHLKEIAEIQGEHLDNLVVAIPMYYRATERAGIKKAMDLAGLNLLSVIAEPIAIAINYLHDQPNRNKNILVCDLGATYFDVTFLCSTVTCDIIEGNKCSIKIIDSKTSDSLGGKAWDDLLFGYILQAFCDKNGLITSEIDDATYWFIRSRAEITKKKLCCAESAKIKIDVDGIMTTILISRNEFEQLTAKLLAQTMSFVKGIVQEYSDIHIDTVLLHGAAARLPTVCKAMEAQFPNKTTIYWPEHAVARGAAFFGNALINNEYNL